MVMKIFQDNVPIQYVCVLRLFNDIPVSMISLFPKLHPSPVPVFVISYPVPDGNTTNVPLCEQVHFSGASKCPVQLAGLTAVGAVQLPPWPPLTRRVAAHSAIQAIYNYYLHKYLI